MSLVKSVKQPINSREISSSTNLGLKKPIKKSINNKGKFETISKLQPVQEEILGESVSSEN